MLIADAARIAAEVAIYRLRRLEMANIAGAATICLALALPVGKIAVRLAFAFGLNLLVYLNNDYLDLAADLRAPGRDDRKTRFLRDHRAAGVTAQLGLLALLLGVCVYMRCLAVPLVLGGGVCWAYSARLRASLTHLESFVLFSPEERYINFVKSNPDIVNRVPDKYIAHVLGITPVSLSRIRKRIAQRKR